MTQMTFTQPRATYQETLAFANAVREAGGGNPLDALMPAVPSDPRQCLIAKNLNFNCRVDGMADPEDKQETLWFMQVSNDDVRDRIAAALELRKVPRDSADDLVIVLPPEIGQVAQDFDRWNYAVAYTLEQGHYLAQDRPEALDRLKEFWPYVEASVKESYANASFVNANGELVL